MNVARTWLFALLTLCFFEAGAGGQFVFAQDDGRAERSRSQSRRASAERGENRRRDRETEASVEESASEVQTGGSLRRSNRMEFDDRLVRGETAGAGAVVLFNRGRRPLPPLTAERTDFSQDTVRTILGPVDQPPAWPTKPARRPRRSGRR
ncbi:MAG: hypothetical protein AAF355_05245 [Myxococcota bacterium]